jgi:hypothetical protein
MTETKQDAVDRIAEQWARERPDLDVGPMLVIGRLHRLAELLDQGLRPVFAEAGLGNGDFDVLASLRRSGPPYRLSPTQLSATTMVTSGAVTKRARADLLLLALASLLVRGGERVGFTGMEGAPASSRLALTRIGRAMFASGRSALPPLVPFARGNQLVWFSDFLDEDVFDAMKKLSQRGVEGHLVRIIDPAEEDFPYSGRTRFESPRGGEHQRRQQTKQQPVGHDPDDGQRKWHRTTEHGGAEPQLRSLDKPEQQCG